MADPACVGISYSHKDTSNHFCYECNDDDLKSASNDFGFYRSKCRNKVYKNIKPTSVLNSDSYIRLCHAMNF